MTKRTFKDKIKVFKIHINRNHETAAALFTFNINIHITRHVYPLEICFLELRGVVTAVEETAAASQATTAASIYTDLSSVREST